MLSSSRCAKVVTAACADACNTLCQALPRNTSDRRSVLRGRPAGTTMRTRWRAQPHVGCVCVLVSLTKDANSLHYTRAFCGNAQCVQAGSPLPRSQTLGGC